jgi:hypothetical protein
MDRSAATLMPRTGIVFALFGRISFFRRAVDGGVGVDCFIQAIEPRVKLSGP